MLHVSCGIVSWRENERYIGFWLEVNLITLVKMTKLTHRYLTLL